MGILSGNPKEEPMHYGEVFSTWNFVMMSNKAIAEAQVLLNHAGDSDLKKLLKESIELGQSEVKKVSELLLENGVAVPPSAPEPPKVDVNDIPVGAKLADPDIAISASEKIAAGLVTCSGIMGQSIREDIAMMFGQFHTSKAALGAKYLNLIKEKGWMIPPPLHFSQKDKVEA
ncbi:DUF3231 family protein [Alkalicoccobacillus porphyridii]|uniref:DUF3231 family protein n=1 Tax=Alkalicoccobacillus porphyridii TaxID=2597270 RepID=A0A554A3B6_9BACI|nr:DUF3231 family protein [Alkalicoccobacillus porphyridii]TSB48178.1 DUF3231 family protein [Alkalicoccobacillus porphyridii]